MRKVDFEILSQSERKVEFNKTRDLDLIKFTLQRATGLEFESFDNLNIDYSFIRHKLEFRSDPELLIRILDDLQKLKIDPIIKSNDGLVYDIDVFFNKIS